MPVFAVHASRIRPAEARRQHRQAGGVAKASHLEPQPLEPARSPIRAQHDRLSCRRKVLLTAPGFNEPPETGPPATHAQETSAMHPHCRGLSLSSHVCVAPRATARPLQTEFYFREYSEVIGSIRRTC